MLFRGTSYGDGNTKAVHHVALYFLTSQLLRLLYPQSPLMSTIGHRCWELPAQANNERHSGPGDKASHHPRAEEEIGKAPRSTGSCFQSRAASLLKYTRSLSSSSSLPASGHQQWLLGLLGADKDTCFPGCILSQLQLLKSAISAQREVRERPVEKSYEPPSLKAGSA